MLSWVNSFAIRCSFGASLHASLYLRNSRAILCCRLLLNGFFCKFLSCVFLFFCSLAFLRSMAKAAIGGSDDGRVIVFVHTRLKSSSFSFSEKMLDLSQPPRIK